MLSWLITADNRMSIVTFCLEAILSFLFTPSTTSANTPPVSLARPSHQCIGGLRVSAGTEATAEEPKEEEPARARQDSERTGHGQAERIDLVLHIWSRAQEDLNTSHLA